MELVNAINKNSIAFCDYVVKNLSDQVKIANKRLYAWNPATCLFEQHDSIDDWIITTVTQFICDTFESYVTERKDSIKKLKKKHERQINEIERQIEEAELYQKKYTQLSNIRNILHQLRTGFEDNSFYDKLDCKKNVLNFKNGMLNLETGEFRERTMKDAFSKCLTYNYSPKTDQTIRDKIMTIYKQIFNDNDEQLEFNMQWQAYSLTGETKEQLFMVYQGESASNGKSTTLKILHKVFPEYIEKLEQDIFNKRSNDKHKYLIKCEKPTRAIYIEEIDDSKLDAKALKDFVDGSKLCVKIMYGTSANIEIQAKVFLIVNGMPRVDNDNGVERRLLLQQFKNQFRDPSDPAHKPNTKGHYVKTKEIDLLFQKQEYKNELVNILLDYTKKYYKDGLVIPESVKKQAKELCEVNDDMKMFIDERFEVTNNEKNIVGKDKFCELFHKAFDCKTPWVSILADAKRVGLQYDKARRSCGHKGVFVGIKYIDPNEQNLFYDDVDDTEYERGVIKQ